MKNQTKLTSPSDHSIKYGIRLKSFLVVETNFNPMYCILFGVYLEQVSQIEKMSATEVYPDGTGYYIFKLVPNCDKQLLSEEIDNEFQKYFIDM